MTEQYIITFEELQELKPDVSEGMYKSTKEKNQEKIIFRVLGRTSKTMTDETISTLISENARIGAELKRATEMVELLSGNRDRDIRKAALDQLFPRNGKINTNGDLEGDWKLDPQSLFKLENEIRSNPQFTEEPDAEVIETVILAVMNSLRKGDAE